MFKLIGNRYGIGLATNLVFTAATPHLELAAYPAAEYWVSRICDAAEWPLHALAYASHLV